MFVLPVILLQGYLLLMKKGLIHLVLDESQLMVYINIAVYIILPIMALVIQRKSFSSSVKKAGSLITRIIPYILILYAVSVLGSIVINQLDNVHTTTNQTMIYQMKNENMLFTAYMAVIAAPITEETVFRCSMLSGTNGIASFIMLIISSILFSAVHLHGMEFGAFLAYALIGLTLGCIYLKHRNLITNILIHAGYNGLALLLSYVMV